ncbi:transglycosylase SLT domain-containing protein [Novosphingobium profundi]|uniref:transglycosylase SLT domain-containing protein n=1 Tax=Novosphingobium profundi TaxID=1774954 RepID=UPI001BDAEE9E|nr:transglycosylase SLT domain-containing protein [Novosphingobium profundi]MBT0667031.1 transglycosylase SLT domain-containing protein [Novosphingobium profundi]
MSVADTFEFDAARANPQGQADTRPPVAWSDFDWDATKASAAQAWWDVPGRAQETRNADILTAAAAMTELNGQSMSRYQFIPRGEPVGVPRANEAQFWRDLAELRRMRPDALTDFARDRADYDAKLQKRFQTGTADRGARMARQGWLGNLAGGLVGAFSDPINVATLPLGGFGKSAAMKILSEGAVQAGVQTLETPLLALERGQQGGELTAREAAWYIGLAGAGGAGLKGLGIAGGKAIDAIPMEAKAALALRFAKPREAITPDEAAALHVLDRGLDVDARNPFVRSLENLEAHAQRIDDTISAMARWPEPARVAAMPPARALMPAGLQPDFDTAWRAVLGIEGGTNRDGSFRTSPAGAIGPAQVMPATAPEAARLAGLEWSDAKYRSDPAYNEALGQAYYREMLRQFDGDPVKAAAAYNAGPGSARRGTGVRGAMARARRAGVPGEWASFLPAETRAYVANFQRRTGMAGDARIDAPAFDEAGLPARPEALDAQRPAVEMPELDRAQFRSEAEWRRTQGELDAEALGGDPLASRTSTWIEARDQLIADQGGEVKGALFHPEVGAIDVKWGVPGTGKSDGFGLSKLVKFHPEVLEDLPRLLDEMEVNPERSGNNRITLESADHKAIVRLDWEGKDQRWLLTAFRREEKAPSNLTTRRGSNDAPDGRSTDAGAEANIDPVLAHVERERARVLELRQERQRLMPDGADADSANAAYRKRAGEIGLDPLSEADITARLRELGTMEAGARERIEIGRARERAGSPAHADEMEAEGLAGPVVHDAEAGAAFDDPRGQGVAQAADTVWHDIQAGQDMVRESEAAIDELDAALREIDPKAVEQSNRELEQAARGMPEQLSFDLGDGKGERTLADIEAELRADEDAISTIESCLRPGPMGGGA